MGEYTNEKTCSLISLWAIIRPVSRRCEWFRDFGRHFSSVSTERPWWHNRVALWDQSSPPPLIRLGFSSLMIHKTYKALHSRTVPGCLLFAVSMDHSDKNNRVALWDQSTPSLLIRLEFFYYVWSCHDDPELPRASLSRAVPGCHTRVLHSVYSDLS